MTVSPNRLHDGSHQPNAGSNGFVSDDHVRQSSLPPTLFKLPNLDANARLSEEQNEAPVGQGHPDCEPRVNDQPGTQGVDYVMGTDSAAIDDSTQGITPGDLPPADLPTADLPTADLPTAQGSHGSFQANYQSDYGTNPGTTPANQSHAAPDGHLNPQAAIESLVNTYKTSQARDVAASPGSEPRPPIGDSPVESDTFVNNAWNLAADQNSSTNPVPSAPTSVPGQPGLPGQSSTPEDDQPTTPTSQGPVPAGAAARASSQDAPAGRSWMDSIGSHGVVIVLLLVVVAAALLTGRGGDDPSSESLSTQSELLNFDELDVDLPLPDHTGRPPVVASVDQPVYEEGAAMPEESIASLSVNDGVPTDATYESQYEAEYTEMAAPAHAEPFEQPSVATLEPPTPSVGASADTGYTEVENSTGVRVNRFMSPEYGTAATTASNRVAAPEPEASLPSLEELAGIGTTSQPAGSAQSGVNSKPGATTRVITQTPAAVSDWMKYLPPLKPAAAPGTNPTP